jgi:hypothetical protein
MSLLEGFIVFGLDEDIGDLGLFMEGILVQEFVEMISL